MVDGGSGVCLAVLAGVPGLLDHLAHAQFRRVTLDRQQRLDHVRRHPPQLGAFGARRERHDICDQPISEQCDIVAIPVCGCLHGGGSPCLGGASVSQALRPMTEAATRAIVCWWAGLRSGIGGTAAESDRRGQRLEVIGAEQPERDQHAPGSDMLPECVDPDRGPGEQVGEQPDDDPEKGLDQDGAAPDPAPGGPGVAMMAGTHPVRRRRKAVLGFHRRHAVLDRVQRARHPRRHEPRQQAERHRRIRTVVSGNLEPDRGLAFVGAVTGKPATPVGVVRAALKLCVTPRLRANVLLGGKVCLVDELHSTAHGPAEDGPRGPLLLLLT